MTLWAEKVKLSFLLFHFQHHCEHLLCCVSCQNSFIIYFLTCPFIYWFAQSGENKLGKSDPYFMFPAYYKRRTHLFIQSEKYPKQSVTYACFSFPPFLLAACIFFQPPIGWLDCPCLCNWPEGFQPLLATALILLTKLKIIGALK